MTLNITWPPKVVRLLLQSGMNGPESDVFKEGEMVVITCEFNMGNPHSAEDILLELGKVDVIEAILLNSLKASFFIKI